MPKLHNIAIHPWFQSPHFIIGTWNGRLVSLSTDRTPDTPKVRTLFWIQNRGGGFHLEDIGRHGKSEIFESEKEAWLRLCFVTAACAEGEEKNAMSAFASLEEKRLSRAQDILNRKDVIVDEIGTVWQSRDILDGRGRFMRALFTFFDRNHAGTYGVQDGSFPQDGESLLFAGEEYQLMAGKDDAVRVTHVNGGWEMFVMRGRKIAYSREANNFCHVARMAASAFASKIYPEMSGHERLLYLPRMRAAAEKYTNLDEVRRRFIDRL